MPAPWRTAFLSHVASMPQPTFVLSTLHQTSNPSSGVPSFVPRARTCVYRGLWACLQPDDRNPAPRNPAIYQSELPVLTTDVRMEKAHELLSSPTAMGNAGESWGGAPVEAVWWAEASRTQWRMRGTAWLLGPDVEEDAEGARAVREALGKRMRRVEGVDGTEEWSWRREVTGHFGNLSPVMRGSFRNPPPGRPVVLPVSPGKGLGLGQRVEDLEDRVARGNFRVVVIVPNEVDQVDLSDLERAKRWLYVYRGLSQEPTQPGGEVTGEWEKVELWP